MPFALSFLQQIGEIRPIDFFQMDDKNRIKYVSDENVDNDRKKSSPFVVVLLIFIFIFEETFQYNWSLQYSVLIVL